VVEGDRCVVGAWNLDNCLQVDEDMSDRGGLYVKKFGDTGNGEGLCCKREGGNDVGEKGEVC
jgi:hypothetical protein